MTAVYLPENREDEFYERDRQRKLDDEIEAKRCPECGSDEIEHRGPVEVYGIETYFKQCANCGWQWDPE